MVRDAIPSEHFEQRELVRWFRQTYPVRIFAVPNGGKRGAAEALRLKIEGVSAGVPDLHVPAWSLWIEMKRIKGGRLSPEQKDWIEYLEGIGHSVIVGYGSEDAIEKIREFRHNCDFDNHRPELYKRGPSGAPSRCAGVG